MKRQTQKRKRGGMRGGPAAAGADSSSNSNTSSNSNRLAGALANSSNYSNNNDDPRVATLSGTLTGLGLGFNLIKSEYDMDIVDEGERAISYDMEVDAFGSDQERRAALFNGIQIICLPLNVPILDFTEDELDDILQKADYIHCKAFGVSTQINRVGNQLQYVPPYAIVGKGAVAGSSLCILCSAPGAVAAAAAGAGSPQGDMILVCIITNYGAASEYIDIWGVAKNPHIVFPNAFKRFLLKYLEENEGPQYINLTVGTDNTVTMTEQGRLRLYTSLGFLISGNQTVEYIYPDSPPLLVRKHIPENRGQVILTYQGRQLCSFLGNLKSSTTGPIEMSATREALMSDVPYPISLEFKESLQGRAAYLYNESRTKLSEVKNRLTDNQAIPIPPPRVSLMPIKALYHMGLQNYKSKNYPGNSFVQSITVPDDFLIFTITSPGSYLWASGDTIDNFVRSIMTKVNEEGFDRIIQNNKSSQKHPIVNLFVDESYTTMLKTFATTETLCKNQTTAGFLAAKIMEQLGRQPFFEFHIPGNPGAAAAAGAAPQVKKYQLDFQLYGPGMKIFNYNMIRNENASDRQNRAGTYVPSDATFADLVQNRNDVAFTDREGKLREYLDFIRGEYPLGDANIPVGTPGADIPGYRYKYILFLFGCSGLERGASQYDLLYELSHRRSVKFTQPEGMTFDNPDFIERNIFNKITLGEHACGDPGANFRIRLAGGKRRKHSRKHKIRKHKQRKTRKH